MSYSIQRRRRWRTLATTLALSLGSLALPAAALADGSLDPSFNFVGTHVGSAAEGTQFTNTENRVPMVVQADGKIVVGGSSLASTSAYPYMTLTRYLVNGQLDPSFGTGGIVRTQFTGTPSNGSPGASGAVAMTLDAGGNIVVAGFGGSQSMVAARFSGANGTQTASVVCYAPHLIDYTARALALRNDGKVVLVGYARDRFTATPTLYGVRAVVNLAAGTNPNGCGQYHDRPNPDTTPGQPLSLSLGSDGVTIDGLSDYIGTPSIDPALAQAGGRFYDAVTVASPTDNRYVVATTSQFPGTNQLDGNAWVERYTVAAGAGAGNGILDATFNALGAAPGRVLVPGKNLHGLALSRTPNDGATFAVGEAVGATAADDVMQVVRIDATGAIGGYGNGGVASSGVAGGNNTGQALVVDATNRITVGGSANLAGTTVLALTRFTPNGVRDATFGPTATGGQVVTAIGSPAVNAYITGIGLTTVGSNPAAGAFIAVSGRVTVSDPNQKALLSVAGRYFATGTPPPPLPPAATTLFADQLTTSTARVSGSVNTNGVASNWWVEYGTTTAYGSQTPGQALLPSLGDLGEQGQLSGLAAGTVYHARLVIQSAGGTTFGNDLAFTTLGVPVPAAPAGGTTATGGTKTATTTTTTTTTVTKVVKKAVKRFCIVPKVTGKKLNKARSTVYLKGCKVQVKYAASKKPNNTVLAQSRKAGKKLGYRAVVRLTVAKTAAAVAKDTKTT